jgi:threonyl-tRNA synthetase
VKQLVDAGMRATLDDRNEKVNLKIREAQLQKIPFMLVVGDREAEAGEVGVREHRRGDAGSEPVPAFVERVRVLAQSRSISA